MNHKNGNGKRLKPLTPRRVDYFRYDEDYECAFLGAFGFSTRFIMSKTKLSANQITYRLQKAEIRRMDFRDGSSEFAQMMLRNVRQKADVKLHRMLAELSTTHPNWADAA